MKKLSLFAVFGFVLFSFAVRAETTAPYTMSNAILREAPAKVAAAYVTVNNPTELNDTLIGAKATWADHIQIHKVSTNDQGVVEMSPIKEVPLPAHGKAELKQGGTHLMIFGVKEKLAVDQKRDITLIFKNAGSMLVPFEVQPIGNIGQQAQSMSHDMHDMPGM